jgi:geranylgeranyl reductase family protein
MRASTTYDAIVVGLGPAGSTAAYEIARAGRAVLALDREQFPRYKVCGGALSSRLDRTIGTAYHESVEATVRGLTFVYNGAEGFHVDADGPLAYFVMRDRFDAGLAERAARAGAHLRYGESVHEIEETAQEVRIRTSHGIYRGRFLVGADGANSRLARRLNPHPLPVAYGLEAEIEHPSAPNEVILEMGAVPGGYGWIFPKRRGMSIGIGGFRTADPQPRAAFRRFVAYQTGLRGVTTAPVGYPIPVYCRGGRVATVRIGLAGDAARLVDPFFGEGIYYGILSGQRLGQEIVRQLDHGPGDLGAYGRWVEADLGPEFAVADRLASIAYGYPRLWYDAMQAHPDVIGWFYEVLRGSIRFQDLWARLRRNVLRLAPTALAGRVTATLFAR